MSSSIDSGKLADFSLTASLMTHLVKLQLLNSWFRCYVTIAVDSVMTNREIKFFSIYFQKKRLFNCLNLIYLIKLRFLLKNIVPSINNIKYILIDCKMQIWDKNRYWQSSYRDNSILWLVSERHPPGLQNL